MTSTHVEALGAEVREARLTPVAVGGALSAVGAVSVVVTSAFYVASPGAMAGPVQPLDLAAAVAGATRGVATLRAAGTVGIFGDLIWAAGVLLVAQELGRRGRGVSAAGWIALFLAIVIFTFVDLMTGYVLPPLAAGGDASAFEGFKRLWDALFLLGTAALGAGVVAAMGGDLASERPMIGRVLAWTALVVGLIAGLDALAGFAGVTAFPTDKVAGASIGLGSVLFIPISLRIARA